MFTSMANELCCLRVATQNSGNICTKLMSDIRSYFRCWIGFSDVLDACLVWSLSSLIEVLYMSKLNLWDSTIYAIGYENTSGNHSEKE